MKLSSLVEGVVSIARGRIVTAKNDIATSLADTIKDLGFQRPTIEFADSPMEDAILYVDFSGHTVMVRVVSDDEIQIQIPEGLSDVANVDDYQKLGGAEQAVRALRRLRLSLRERLIDRV